MRTMCGCRRPEAFWTSSRNRRTASAPTSRPGPVDDPHRPPADLAEQLVLTELLGRLDVRGRTVIDRGIDVRRGLQPEERAEPAQVVEKRPQLVGMRRMSCDPRGRVRAAALLDLVEEVDDDPVEFV